MCDVFIYFSVDLEGMNLQDAAASGKLEAIGILSALSLIINKEQRF